MAKLLITIWDNDQTTILAPAGTVFEWNPNSTHQRICGYLLYVDEFEFEFL